MDLIPSNEYVEFEDRVYNNPQVGIDETNTFIDQLRATQGQQNQQILSDTQALGTDVPSNLGGLTGGESYFASRYQTAPTVSATQNLRTAAQAAALNDVLANEQAIWKKRYQDAYRNYQKRQNDKVNTPTTTNPYTMVEGDDPGKETTTPKGANETSLTLSGGQTGVVDPITGALTIIDTNTMDRETIQPGQSSKTRKKASAAVGGGEIRILPNGNRVLVKPGYGLTKDNGKYYLVNQNTGARTEVGGY